MVLGRDMALPAGYEASWGEATRRKQKRIGESCERESRRRAGRAYQAGGKALAKVPKKVLRKLEKARRGPSAAAKHNFSGTAKAQLGPCAAQAASARRVGPFHE